MKVSGKVTTLTTPPCVVVAALPKPHEATQALGGSPGTAGPSMSMNIYVGPKMAPWQTPTEVTDRVLAECRGGSFIEQDLSALAVTGGVPHACHPSLDEVQEAQEVDLKARWDRYERSKRKPAIEKPACPEVGEVDRFPSVAETRALGLRAEVHRAVAQLREISATSSWPIRERLQSAAAVMLEQAALRFADDNLRDRPPNERLTWVPRFNNGNGGASITLDGHTVFVSGSMARELSEALFRHQHVIASVKEERGNAIVQRDEARDKLMTATQIIDFVWPRLERVAGKSLERDLINAATLCTFLPGGVNADRTDPSPNPIYCTGFVTILAVKDRQIVQRQSWTSDRPGFKALGDHLGVGGRQGTWTWRGSIVGLWGVMPMQWQGEWTEEAT